MGQVKKSYENDNCNCEAKVWSCGRSVLVREDRKKPERRKREIEN